MLHNGDPFFFKTLSDVHHMVTFTILNNIRYVRHIAEMNSGKKLMRDKLTVVVMSYLTNLLILTTRRFDFNRYYQSHRNCALREHLTCCILTWSVN